MNKIDLSVALGLLGSPGDSNAKVVIDVALEELERLERLEVRAVQLSRLVLRGITDEHCAEQIMFLAGQPVPERLPERLPDNLVAGSPVPGVTVPEPRLNRAWGSLHNQGD